ncbi:hypothetical protein UlMin_004793 [Ulmus minor]
MYSFYISGKYYLVDADYKNKAGFLAPFRGENYHLHDRRQEDDDRRKEMFNYRHASLCNVIERTFGVWKNRFCILRGIPRYPLEKQRYLVIACAVHHNFIKLFSDEDAAFNPKDDIVDHGNDEDDVGKASTQQKREENNYMAQFRDELATSIWNNKQD